MVERVWVTCHGHSSPHPVGLGYPAQPCGAVRRAGPGPGARAVPIASHSPRTMAALCITVAATPQPCQAHAEALLVPGDGAKGFLWVGAVPSGALGLAMQGQDAAGLAQMHQGMAGALATGPDAGAAAPAGHAGRSPGAHASGGGGAAPAGGALARDRASRSGYLLRGYRQGVPLLLQQAVRIPPRPKPVSTRP